MNPTFDEPDRTNSAGRLQERTHSGNLLLVSDILRIDVDHDRETLILMPRGRLDTTSTADFEREVMGHLGKGATRLAVDFDKLDFVSSSAIRILLITAKALREREGRFALCNLKPHVSEVFRISGIHRVIDIYGSRGDALAAIDA